MNSAGYRVPSGQHRVEEVVRRSRFITTVARAPDAAAAQAHIASMRREFPDATHHCWAFVAGPPGDTAQVGMSDDGEPHGTAGRPMLTALLHGDIGEVVAVCTRYFGGVKLGTGGLGRAYSGGVKLALESLPTELRVARTPVVVIVAYDAVEALRRLWDEWGGVLEGEEYGEEVTYRGLLPVADVDVFARALADATRGQASVRWDGERQD